jgi:hypothetical protein
MASHNDAPIARHVLKNFMADCLSVNAACGKAWANALLTYDRAIAKIDPEVLLALH